MKVTHDIIAAVSGPGWKFGLSRILVNEDNEGVVFVAGSELPHASFKVETISTSKGKGVTADGGELSWRRRGSSCQYKLAKCKINTSTMTEWWEASLTPEPAEPEVKATAEPVAAKGDVVEVVTNDLPDEVVEAQPVETEKPKRKRRTKAEIEADKEAAEKAKLEELL